MSVLSAQLESVLFVASKPLSIRKLSNVLDSTENNVAASLLLLKEKYAMNESGIVLLQNNDEWQLVSHPGNKKITEDFVKAEITGELTKPQLETLTVVSYCGPITKPELEQLRGVNCSLILRNLMMRDLVKETEGSGLFPAYEVTMTYLKHLGISSLTDLPDYAELHNHVYISQALDPKEPT